MNWILLGIYLFCILGLFIFVGIVLMHIGEFKKYSHHIVPVIRVYIALIVLITIWGGYMVVSSDVEPISLKDPSPRINIEF